MLKLNMPETVPVLTEDHFCKHALNKGKRHCMMGWCDYLSKNEFGNSDVKVYKKFEDAIMKEILKKESYCQNLAEFNDTHTNRQNAEVFNSAMRRLGYTEIIEE